MVKNINKNTRTTSLMSFWCFYYWLGTYFTPFSSVSIIDFEQVNVSWVLLEKIAIIKNHARNVINYKQVNVTWESLKKFVAISLGNSGRKGVEQFIYNKLGMLGWNYLPGHKTLNEHT